MIWARQGQGGHHAFVRARRRSYRLAAGRIVSRRGRATAQMDIQSGQTRRLYYVALAAATLLVAATGHIGGVLVWGVDFLRQ